jgi:hypothetical protein
MDRHTNNTFHKSSYMYKNSSLKPHVKTDLRAPSSLVRGPFLVNYSRTLNFNDFQIFSFNWSQYFL